MMKQLYFLIILAFAAVEAQAQRPFLEAGKTWVVEELWTGDGVEEDFCSKFTRYHLEGDTIVGGRECMKFYAGENQLLACMYEEEERVFAIPRGETERQLLYDFSLAVGDSVFIEVGEDVSFPGEVYADSVLSVEGRSYACLYLMSHPYQNFRDYWPEMYALLWEGLPEEYVQQEYDNYMNVRCNEAWIRGVGSWLEPYRATGWLTDSSSLPDDIKEQTIFGKRLQHCYVGEETLYYRTPVGKDIDLLSVQMPTDNTSGVTTPSLYTLDGRRLSTPPARGVYIIGGKKRVK